MFIRALCVLGIKAGDGRSPIYPGSVVEVDDEVGLRMINNGSAKEMPRPDEKTARPASPKPGMGENPPKAVNAPEGHKNAKYVKGHLDGEDLESLSFTELKALAKDLGIEAGKIKSKTGMIKAITAVEVEAPDDDLPELLPQDVVDA